MMFFRRLFAYLLALMQLLMLTAGHAFAQQAGSTRLSLSYVPANIYSWDVDVALEKGFFSREGFAPDVVPAQSSPQIIQMLVGRSVDMALTQPEPVIQAISRGAKELGIMAEPTSRPDWYFVVRPEIKDWADLKGKRIGFSSFSVGEYWYTRDLLEAHALKPGDYEAIIVGTSPLKLSSLQNASIAGTVLFQPTGVLAEKNGMKVLFRYSDENNISMVVYTVTKSWAAENSNGQRLRRAINKARTWLFDPANRNEALQIASKYTKRDIPVLEKVYELYFGPTKLYSADGAVNVASIERLIATMSANNQIPAGQAPSRDSYLLPTNLGGLFH
jgi:ABC-type nitrate/sulfonate/bicarbonate transport system substrate-binding protein